MKIGKIEIVPFKQLFESIKKSCEKNDEMSSTRITSYIILCLIVLFVFYFLGIGIWIVVKSATVTIPNELLIVFGALLTHQLTLLGINKHHETKQKSIQQLPPESTSEKEN